MAVFRLRQPTGGSSLRNGDSLRAGAPVSPPGDAHPVIGLSRLGADALPEVGSGGAVTAPAGPHPVFRLSLLGVGGTPVAYHTFTPKIPAGGHPVFRLSRLGVAALPQPFFIGAPIIPAGPHPVGPLSALSVYALTGPRHTFTSKIAIADVFGQLSGTLTLVSSTANGVQDMAGVAAGLIAVYGSARSQTFAIAPGLLQQVRRARPRTYRVPAQPRHG